MRVCRGLREGECASLYKQYKGWLQIEGVGDFVIEARARASARARATARARASARVAPTIHEGAP